LLNNISITYNETQYKILNSIKLTLKLNDTTSNITSVKRNLKEKGHLESLDIEDTMLLERLQKEWGSVNLIELAQDRNKWQTLVNTVIHHPFS